MDEKNATEISALIESKVLLKNQEQGMITAMQQVLGLKKPPARDVVSKIAKLDKLLTPEDKEKFAADLVSKKLGLKQPVSVEEAKEIARLSKLATEAQKNKKNDFKSIADAGVKQLDLVDYINSLKPQGNPWLNLAQYTSLPQTCLTTITHFSAPFVQNYGMIGTKEWYQGLPKMFNYWKNESAYKELQGYISAHPYHAQAKAAKLGITKLGDALTEREEATYSSLLEHIPGLRVPVKMSNRAFAGYNNYVRFTRFCNILDALKMRGEDISVGSKAVRDVAIIVNDFTGRGALGVDDIYANTSPVLNTFLFTPRGLSSIIGMFDPIKYAKLDPYVRYQGLKQLASMALVTAGILELAQVGGAKVDWKTITFKFGKTTFSPAGRISTYLKLWETMITGKKVNAEGISYDITKGYKAEGRLGVIGDFFRGKLAPFMATIVDAAAGGDQAGNKFDIGTKEGITKFAKTEAYNKMTMITVQDFINMATNDPNNLRAIITSPLAIFGMDMRSDGESKWDKDSGKIMGQFYSAVGKEKFSKANKEYNQKFDDWMSKAEKDSKFKSLSDEDKMAQISAEKKRIKSDIFRENDFRYKQGRRKKFTILSEDE
jgi:hypothetical protein